MNDIDRLRSFAQDIMRSWPEGDVDGADLQEMAKKHGLLTPVEVTEPCGEDGACNCAAYGGFPMTCYRKTPLLKGTDR